MQFPKVWLFGSLIRRGRQAGDIDLILLQSENWEKQLAALEELGHLSGKDLDVFIEVGENSSVAFFDVRKGTWSLDDRGTVDMDWRGWKATQAELVGLARGERGGRMNREALPVSVLARRRQVRLGVEIGTSEREVSEMVRNKEGWYQIWRKTKMREGPYSSLEEAARSNNARGAITAWRVWWRGHVQQAKWMEYPLLGQAVRDLVRQFEEVGKRVDSEEWARSVRVPEKRIWQCAQGAVFLAWLADEMHLERQLQVGLYWHKTWESLARSLGQSVEECQEERGLWDEAHARVPLDEHHHWIKLTDPVSGEDWIIDPNGESRNEARVQSENARYEADDAEGKWSHIDSKTDVQAYMQDDEGVLQVWREMYEEPSRIL